MDTWRYVTLNNQVTRPPVTPDRMAGGLRASTLSSISLGFILLYIISWEVPDIPTVVKIDFADDFGEIIEEFEEKGGREGAEDGTREIDIGTIVKKDIHLISDKQDPLVAVCVAGVTRSLLSPIVYKRLRSNKS
ncbi:hypothetical protein AAMO2058_001593600 [Amorphochlora amoebiformis]